MRTSFPALARTEAMTREFSIHRFLADLAATSPAAPAAVEREPAAPVVEKPAVPARSFDVRYMAGKCANGAHRDAGPLYHAVICNPRVYPTVDKALCGRSPALQWSDHREGQAVTCPKCLKALKRLGLEP